MDASRAQLLPAKGPGAKPYRIADPNALVGRLDVEWLLAPTAGARGFPADLSLQQPGPLGLEPQLLTWMRRNAGAVT